MKKLLLILLFTFSLAGYVSAQEEKEIPKITDKVSNEGWTNDANEAFQLVEKENYPILLNFTGSDWCGWCKKIKSEIFDTKEFKAWVKENNVILLELDFPKGIKQSDLLRSQNQYLAQEFQVRGYPTIFMIKGQKMIQTGYVKGGPANWIASVENDFKNTPSDQK
ncbi:thioredoxin family protein [Flammeovirga sp. EKP202]|nr:thioredoxin family protein [Flammeovirga sp. EKP202]